MIEAMAEYVSSGGDFNRDTNYITTRITADGRDGYPVEPSRYRLIVARACPWANRAIIVRRLLGLEDVLSIGFCGPTHDARSWTFDLDPGGIDPVLKIPRLQDAYFARDPGLPEGHHGACDRRRTDRAGRHQRLRADDARPVHRVDGVSPRRRTRAVSRRRCATRSTRSPSGSTPRSTTASTGAASPAHRRPTTRPTTGCSPRSTGSTSGWRISGILVGDTITEADVRLFTTLARFDPVYHGHFKTNRSKLDEMPALWALCARPVPDPRLRRHHRLRPDQAALLHRAHRHQPDAHRAEGARPVELADTARPGSVGRQAVRRRLTAGADPGGRAGARGARSGLGPGGPHRPLRVRPRKSRCPPRRAPASAAAPRSRTACRGGDPLSES